MCKTPDLVIVGSVALDSVRTPYGEHERILGGSACYAGVAASYFTQVGIVGVIGRDFPQAHLDLLASRGIDLAGVHRQDGTTFHWKGYYEGAMDRAITVDTHLGVFESFSPDIPEDYRSAPYLFLGNIHPALQLRVLSQLTEKTIVALDTMNYWIKIQPDLLHDVIAKIDLLFINEAEIQQLTGVKNLPEAADRILKDGPRFVVLKRGGHGATVHGAEGVVAAPALPLRDVKDPTGAGDTFAGGFLGYLAQSGPDLSLERLREALWMGTALASHTVQDFSLLGLCRASSESIFQRCRQIAQMVNGRVPNVRITGHE
ncbi:sugar kinase [bacterium]|nr:sugar kinase [bacterium]